MRTQTIRSLDYWLGIPACALLTMVRRVIGERRVAPRRVMFVKFIEQGATVLAQDAIRRAVARVGRDNVFFCVFDSNRAILEVLGVIPSANVLCIRDRHLATFAIDFVRALLTVRAQRVDTIIDMEFFSRASAVFAFLCGASTRAGLHRFTGELPYRGDLMTHRVQYNPHVHVSLQYLTLVEAAFGDNLDEPLPKAPIAEIDDGATPTARFVPREDDTARMRALVGGGPIILLHPNASDLLPLRKWEGAKFATLTRRLLEAFPQSHIVITGAPADQTGAEQLCRAVGSPRVISAAGRTSLRELLTLYTLADVLVTNDSGPAHFASLTPIRTVVLFGPETPHLFGSRSPATTIIWKQLACSPCLSVFNHRLSPCRNNVCMQLITVDEVFDAVRAAMGAA